MSFFQHCENCLSKGIKTEINSYWWTCCLKCNKEFLANDKLNMYYCENPQKDDFGALICGIEVNKENHIFEDNFLVCLKCGFKEQIN